jgi:hypothetical protein
MDYRKKFFVEPDGFAYPSHGLMAVGHLGTGHIAPPTASASKTKGLRPIAPPSPKPEGAQK